MVQLLSLPHESDAQQRLYHLGAGDVCLGVQAQLMVFAGPPGENHSLNRRVTDPGWQVPAEASHRAARHLGGSHLERVEAARHCLDLQ